jgi:sigma-B regulation protein RsbU (phosphoserine phosphatase)
MIFTFHILRVIQIPRPVLIVFAVLYAAATVLYSTLWMVDTRVQKDLSSVELGFGTDFLPSENAQLVTSIYPESPAEKAGLLSGDKIILIEGNRVEDANCLTRIWKQHNPGDTVRLSVVRHGLRNPLPILGIFRLRQSMASEGNFEQFAGEVRGSFPVPFVVVGLIVLFLRIEDPIVWILAFLFGSFAATPGFGNKLSAAPAFLPFAMAYQTIFVSLLGSLFYFFFSLFPVRSPIDRRAPWLKWISILIGLTFTISGIRTGRATLPPPLYSLTGEILSIKITFLFVFIFSALGLVSLAMNFVYAQNLEVRRNIRVILWGSGIGVIPSLLRAAAEEFLGFHTPNWLVTLLVVSLFIFPLSFAYAVVKHRVLEIPVLLKRSARYLLVQRGFTFLLSLLSIGLVILFAQSVSNYLGLFAQVTLPLSLRLVQILELHSYGEARKFTDESVEISTKRSSAKCTTQK